MKQVIVTHPGIMVANILDDLGAGVQQFARNIGVTFAAVSRFLSGKTAFPPALAIRISAALGSTPEFWLRLQTHCDLRLLEDKIDISGVVLFENLPQPQQSTSKH
ncbi:TPA: HigA family addiction module antidote protein [Providencia stuartii]|nr:HigA family addiction module antidote protein [Providencia stuartii]